MNKKTIYVLIIIGVSLSISGYVVSNYEISTQEPYIDTEIISDDTYVKTIGGSYYYTYYAELAYGQEMTVEIISDNKVGMWIWHNAQTIFLETCKTYSNVFTEWGTYKFSFEVPIYYSHSATYQLHILITEEVEKIRTNIIRPYESLIIISYIGVPILIVGIVSLFRTQQNKPESLSKKITKQS